MSNLLYFRFNNSDYLVFSDGDNISLGRVVDNNIVSINDCDGLDLKDIVNLICSNDLDDVLGRGIVVLNNKKLKINSVEKSILLSFSDDKKSLFLSNCKELNNDKSHLFIWIILFALVIFSCLIIGFYTFKAYILNHYSYSYDINIDYDIIDISSVDVVNFDDSFVSFYNPYGYFEFVSNDNEFLNLYESSDVKLSIERVNDYFDYDVFFDEMYSKFNDFSRDYPLVDLKNVFVSNGVFNKYDLMEACLLNVDNSVDLNSSRDDILNKFVFDIYTPIVIPYDDLDRFMLFRGGVKGSAFITNDSITIELVYGDDLIRVTFFDFSDGSFMLTEDEIVNFVSSIHFK